MERATHVSAANVVGMTDTLQQSVCSMWSISQWFSLWSCVVSATPSVLCAAAFRKRPKVVTVVFARRCHNVLCSSLSSQRWCMTSSGPVHNHDDVKFFDGLISAVLAVILQYSVNVTRVSQFPLVIPALDLKQ